MDWTIARGGGLNVGIIGILLLASVLYAESTPLVLVLALLGLSFVYHGVSIIRTGSYNPV